MERPRLSLGSALLAHVVVATLAITLMPFHLRAPTRFTLTGYVGPFDLVANIGLFLPIGFLFQLSQDRGRPPRLLPAFALGLVLSGLIEGAQLFIPGRCSSVLDMATNTLGALAGAALHRAARRALDARLASRLALELPLMALFYLLVPLLWIGGLVSMADPSRLWSSVFLGLFGGAVLASVYRHRLRRADVLSPGRVGLGAAAWFVVASLPAVFVDARFVAIGAAIVGVATRWMAASPTFLRIRGRRFEVPTLLRIWPFFAAYLWALALAPRVVPPPGVLASLGQLVTLERLAAFSLLGFLLAELRGRRDDRGLRRWIAPVARQALAIAAALELASAIALGRASVARPFALAALALAGAGTYRLQVAAVRELLGRKSSMPPSISGAPSQRRRTAEKKITKNCAPVQAEG
jgi:VanZ family protein